MGMPVVVEKSFQSLFVVVHENLLFLLFKMYIIPRMNLFQFLCVYLNISSVNQDVSMLK